MQSQVNYINPEDFERILDEIPYLNIRKWSDNDIKWLFKILYWIALRPIEGIKLSREDFNLEDRYVYLGKTKTMKGDKAVIPKLFTEPLRQYLAIKQDGRLFPGLSYNTFYPWTVKLGQRLGIKAWIEKEKDTGEKTKGHIFRKTNLKDMYFGTWGERIDPILIAGQSRHKNTAVLFNNYLRLGSEATKEVW